MSPPFHPNKLESIGAQLELGLKVEDIAVNEKCSIDTIYRVQRRIRVTGQAINIIPDLGRGCARMITPEIEEV
jgi:transposase